LDWLRELAYIPSLAVAVTAGLLIALDSRRLGVGLLAVQYLCVAWLAGLALPLPIAAAKLVAGLMTCGVLALSVAALHWEVPRQPTGAVPRGHAFRWIAVLIVATVALGLGRENWMGLPGVASAAAVGSSFLMALGLLQIGITEDPLRVGIGLLTLLSGFEIAYSAVEPSLAVIALLAAVHLGIALVVSYLLLVVRETTTEADEVQ
jgi:hypothetical protein